MAGLAALRADLRAPVSGVLVSTQTVSIRPSAFPRFVAASSQADLVIGNRFADGGVGMPVVRRLANRISSAVVSRTSGKFAPDSQCGMRLLHRRALFDVPFPPAVWTRRRAHLKRCLAAGVTVGWVPIPAIYAEQASSFRPVQDSVAVMRAAIGR